MSKRQAEIEKRRDEIKLLKSENEDRYKLWLNIDKLISLYGKEKKKILDKRQNTRDEISAKEKELKDYIIESEMFDEGSLLALPGEILEKIVGYLDVPSRARIAMCNKRLKKWFEPDGRDAVPLILERHRRLLNNRNARPSGITTLFLNEHRYNGFDAGGILVPPEGYKRCVYALGKVFFVKNQELVSERASVDFDNNLIVASHGIVAGNEKYLFVYSHYNSFDHSCSNGENVFYVYDNTGKKIKEYIHNFSSVKYLEVVEKNNELSLFMSSDYKYRGGVEMKQRPIRKDGSVFVNVKGYDIDGFLEFKNIRSNGFGQASYGKNVINHAGIYQYGATKELAVIIGFGEICVYKKTEQSGREYKFMFKQKIRMDHKNVFYAIVNDNGIFLIPKSDEPIMWLALR